MTTNIYPQRKGFLNRVERIGNVMPGVTMLFVYALIICWLLSFLLSFVNFDYYHPISKEKISIVNLFQYEEIILFVTGAVKNFINFPPFGITIVSTLGIGIAESSGFIKTALKKMLSFITPKMLTPTVAFVGIVSHLASDSAYVILMPVSAMMFYACGRHPLAGIATAFAGLAGGFTASYTPSIIDPIMQSFTQDAAQMMAPGYHVNVLCNYFFSLGATFGVILICWFITEKVVEPWLNKNCPVSAGIETDTEKDLEKITPEENRAFRIAGSTVLLLGIGLIALLWPETSPMRAPDGSMTSPKAPIMQIVVPLLFLFFAVPGIVYGYLTKSFTSSRDVIKSMENITQSLIPFIVFVFFAAQFLYSFHHSNLGTLLALSGAELLRTLEMPSGLTVFGVIILTAIINIMITSATSKWAIMAPVLVPMLMAVGISPELTQAAFRVSDSAMNVSTPMFPFYPLILMYCQKYYKNAGIGTLCSMMLPFTIGLLIILTATLYVFWAFDIPIGFDSGYTWHPAQ
ncbi:AbgT family transporter [Xenorhabdus bharatensis]|uniref:AbgT family transporter n=1 Tax=Xenorhabdus bharatensis TaxID=3136256 RepID=UPI0030F394D4